MSGISLFVSFQGPMALGSSLIKWIIFISNIKRRRKRFSSRSLWPFLVITCNLSRGENMSAKHFGARGPKARASFEMESEPMVCAVLYPARKRPTVRQFSHEKLVKHSISISTHRRAGRFFEPVFSRLCNSRAQFNLTSHTATLRDIYHSHQK